MDFMPFKRAIQAQFKKMSNYTLFRTDIPGDKLWETYLSSFPEGTNPIFRERTEHDCSCCRQFIKNLGGVIAFTDDGATLTIWDTVDVSGIDRGYLVVAEAMRHLVVSGKIENIFLHSERTVGTEKNFEETTNGVLTWEHFHVTLPPAIVCRDIGTKQGEARASHDVLKRSLIEIGVDTIDTVLELIDANSLYRGEENRFALQRFKSLKLACANRNERELDDFAWTNAVELPTSVSRIRNTSIGTLLVDIESGLSLEDAVKKFEAMVAPANYKRPTALVTKAMIEKAKKTVEDLGLTPALERRYARIGDITVNNVLFADRDARRAMGSDVFGQLADAVKIDPKKFDRVEEVGIDKFLTDILPNAKSIEAFVENRHSGNFMSLITAVDASAPWLFKWENPFSWSYNGDVTDSIKERVKQAGGNVTGELCCRLAWDYADDLDFHMHEPGGNHIHFGNRRRKSANGGMLDVDANGCDGTRDNPCENIFYEKIGTMRDGTYTLEVNNFSRRSSGVGFEIEIDLRGEITHLAYDRVLPSKTTVVVANIIVRAGVVTIQPAIESTSASKRVWNIDTQTFRRVTSIMLSPNHWDGQGVGNKHWFFMLDGCANDGTARGFYNEFLKSELDPHRKVLEMVGAKMRTDETSEQLSGLGFSSTQRNSVLLRVTGNTVRTFKVLF